MAAHQWRVDFFGANGGLIASRTVECHHPHNAPKVAVSELMRENEELYQQATRLAHSIMIVRANI